MQIKIPPNAINTLGGITYTSPYQQQPTLELFQPKPLAFFQRLQTSSI